MILICVHAIGCVKYLTYRAGAMLTACAVIGLRHSQKGLQEIACQPRGLSPVRAAAIWAWRVGVWGPTTTRSPSRHPERAAARSARSASGCFGALFPCHGLTCAARSGRMLISRA